MKKMSGQRQGLRAGWTRSIFRVARSPLRSVKFETPHCCSYWGHVRGARAPAPSFSVNDRSPPANAFGLPGQARQVLVHLPLPVRPVVPAVLAPVVQGMVDSLLRQDSGESV